MPPGRPREFDRTTALRRAMDTFWSHGYQDASITDLTAAMGIAAPSLYAAFGSKAELFREAADLYQAEAAAEAAQALESGPTARASVEGMLRANARLFTRPSAARGCLLTLAASTCREEEDTVRRYLEQSRRDRLRVIERRLGRAAAEGEHLPDVPARELAAYLDTVIQGMAVRAHEGTSLRSLYQTIALVLAAWDALTGDGGDGV